MAVQVIPTRLRRRPRPSWAIEPRAVVEPLDSERKRLVRERDGGICGYCGIRCNPQWGDDYQSQVDHIVARKDKLHRGTNNLWNLIEACRRCNLSKGNKFMFFWLEQQAEDDWSWVWAW